MDNNNQHSHEEASAQSLFFRAVQLFTGDMRTCREWVKKQSIVIQLVDWIFRGIAQVIFVNNPLSGLLITAGLFLQNPWWALNGLLGTLVSTVSAIVLQQNREAVSAGLYGYNGTLVGILMAVFSANGSWYWWLLLPNIFMSMLCPVVSSALSSVANKWDLPVVTLPFNILVYLHIAATGVHHPYFPEVDIQPKIPLNDSMKSLSVFQLFLSVPAGVGQVYGCDSPWTGGLILLALLLSSPIICFHAMVGSAAGMMSGLALAAAHKDIYSGLWGYNSALSCIAIGGVFYVITWQTHLLAVMCALLSAYMTSAISKLMSVIAAICRLPLSVVSYPEENRRYQKQLKASEKVQHSQQRSSQEEASLKDYEGPNTPFVGEKGCSESV
ncbi:urea transporter 2-like isoform X2 [Channa argus]|uniref:urea transporter 2-like isoform X2 n=1 Tax=Channa argus TaxID=215402 RepID=UPI0035220C9F